MIITIARKPLIGSVVQNITLHSTGGLNIDDSRIGLSGGTSRSHQSEFSTEDQKVEGAVHATRGWRTGHTVSPLNKGRYPANLILSHLEGCSYRGSFVTSNKQVVISSEEVYTDGYVHSGYKRSGRSSFTHKIEGQVRQYGEETIELFDCERGCPVLNFSVTQGYNDKGSASRFFKIVRDGK